MRSTTYTVGERGERPWGSWELLACGEGYDHHRSEHWVVVGGAAWVTREEQSLFLQENEGIFLPLGCIHRLENREGVPLTLIEVQTGACLGEDDIVRLEDVYGRP